MNATKIIPKVGNKLLTLLSQLSESFYLLTPGKSFTTIFTFISWQAMPVFPVAYRNSALAVRAGWSNICRFGCDCSGYRNGLSSNRSARRKGI